MWKLKERCNGVKDLMIGQILRWAMTAISEMCCLYAFV